MPEFPTGDPSKGIPKPLDPTVPQDWKMAVMDLIAARTELIRLELTEFRRQSTRRATLLILAILAAASAWLLLLAGAVPLLAKAFDLSWPIMALLLSAHHVAVVAFLLFSARRSSGPAFPATFSEFQKDREWIENLTKTPKS